MTEQAQPTTDESQNTPAQVAATEPTKPASALERLEALEKTVEDLRNLVSNTSNGFNYVVGELGNLKASLAGLGKTQMGLVKELVEKKIVDNDGIMSHIRKFDDDQDRQRIQQLVKAKIIKNGETVGMGSLVTISNSVLRADSKLVLAAGYRIIEMPNVVQEGPLFKEIINRKVGDQFQIPGNDPGDKMIITIKEIYELAPQGQSAPAPEQPQEAAPATTEPTAPAAVTEQEASPAAEQTLAAKA